MNEQTKQDSPVLYTEDTQTPTNVNTTMQAPVTKDEDGVILDDYAAKDQAGKIDNTTYATTPNTTTSSKTSSTGSGLNAAEGTTYSWEKKASDRANLDYQSAVLESKSNYLTNRQELETQGQQMQDQVAMQKYSQNQSSEKAGWTGGYILDTERQMAYLKQTIQSQMYGQMELQKYGYDTSLAAARLAYDTNKYDLALEYYNTALSRAVSEAEITGYYVSPETAEMLNEYSVASQILNDETATEEDKQRADKVLASVYEWFEANGISKQGVETYSHLVDERTNKMSIETTLKYIDTATKQIDADTFTKVDTDGNAIFNDDNTATETINFKSATQEEILAYITNNEVATQQFYGYLDNKITGDMVMKFEDYCVAKGFLKETKDANGIKSYEPVGSTDYKALIYQYLQSSEAYSSIIKKLGLSEEDSNTDMMKILEKYDFEIDLPDGSTLVTTLQELNESLTNYDTSGINPSIENLLEQDGNGGYKNAYIPTNQSVTIGESNATITHIKDSNLIFWDATRVEEFGNTYSGGGPNFNISGYANDVEAQIDSKLTSEQTDTIKQVYKRINGTDMASGTTFFYNGKLYIYSTKDYCHYKPGCYEVRGGNSKELIKQMYNGVGQTLI